MAEIVSALGHTSPSWVVTDFYPDRFPGLPWSALPYESAGKLMARGTIELPTTIKYPDIAIVLVDKSAQRMVDEAFRRAS